jgi:hypothetical protein
MYKLKLIRNYFFKKLLLKGTIGAAIKKIKTTNFKKTVGADSSPIASKHIDLAFNENF